MRLAITGGTGFVGRHLLRLARAAGQEVNALVRRPQPSEPGVRWIEGALDNADSLVRLVEGCDAVIHVAGVVNAPDTQGYIDGNIAGTAAMLAATEAAGIRRFVHVSSLAAREPGLSDYGWSKAESETLVTSSGLDWTIIRPPAIYGPGDTEMLELFRLARRGLMPLPPGGRLSLIHVHDLVRLLLVLVLTHEPIDAHATLEPDDGVEGGWGHRDLAHAIGGAIGRRVLPMPVPAPLLRFGAFADGLIRRKRAKLTPDRVRYFIHPDWVVSSRPPSGLWRPAISTPAGLRGTVDWYRGKGWL